MSEGGRAAMPRGHSALVVLLCALRATTPARFPVSMQNVQPLGRADMLTSFYVNVLKKLSRSMLAF